ncbi:AzlC family ABC transporter permease [Celeribacter arenosi]|uniref:AzlC family ABC transporter permease n=1 Tax=Celeribacter arenosi TaxID=792649 RepID=A0ABP7K1X5_9RHOB
MPRADLRSQFRRGFVDSLPFYLVVGPFGLIFGVIATEAGLNLVEVMGFSILVIAGASQLAALQLMSENAPTVIVLATALAVNMRMAMYSASLTPHIGKAPFWMRALAAYFLFDQPYALSMIDYEKEPERSAIEKITYFAGVGVPMSVVWYAATLAGALLGERIPGDIGLDFAVPITFLAVVAPMLKSLAHVAAAFTSVALVIVLGFMPYGSGLLVAALIALIVGAQVEIWTEKRKKGLVQ